MRNLVLATISGLALVGFASPAAAQFYPSNGDEHAEQHDEIGEQHGGVHDELDEIHGEAHEQGVNRHEHNRLHRHLGRAHSRADGQLEAKHNYEHQAQTYGGYGAYGYQSGRFFVASGDDTSHALLMVRRVSGTPSRSRT